MSSSTPIQPGAVVYSQGFGSRPEDVEVPHYDTRPPTSTDVNFPIGKSWIDTTGLASYILVGKSASAGVISATWAASSGGSTALNTLTGNSGGAVPPTAGNINTLGTGSITVAGVPGTSTLTTQLTGLTLNAIQVGAGTATLTQLGPTNRAVLTTGATGVPALTALATNGQVIIGSTAGAPAAATLTAGSGISITNGSNSITVATTTPAGNLIFNYTNVTSASSPYTVLLSDMYLSCDSSGGAITLRFPNAPTQGMVWVVKDRTGSAATNNITVTSVGGVVTFDGSTSYTINTNKESINLIFNGTNYEVF